MSENAPSILLIGYGNPGRLDDGLGPALAGAIAEHRIPGVAVDSNYQLTVEDAAAVAEHDVVIFADADTACPPPFRFEPLEPKADCSFSTHSIEPAAVLALARDLFGSRARGFILGIRGYEFNEYREALSDQAKLNLQAAVEYLQPRLDQRNFQCVTGAPGSAETRP